jgi:hypothetical protein
VPSSRGIVMPKTRKAKRTSTVSSDRQASSLAPKQDRLERLRQRFLKAGRTAEALPDRTAMSDSAAVGPEFVVPAALRPRGRDLIGNAPG